MYIEDRITQLEQQVKILRTELQRLLGPKRFGPMPKAQWLVDYDSLPTYREPENYELTFGPLPEPEPPFRSTAKWSDES